MYTRCSRVCCIMGRGGGTCIIHECSPKAYETLHIWIRGLLWMGVACLRLLLRAPCRASAHLQCYHKNGPIPYVLCPAGIMHVKDACALITDFDHLNESPYWRGREPPVLAQPTVASHAAHADSNRLRSAMRSSGGRNAVSTALRAHWCTPSMLMAKPSSMSAASMSSSVIVCNEAQGRCDQLFTGGPTHDCHSSRDVLHNVFVYTFRMIAKSTCMRDGTKWDLI